jgi:putative transposase
MCCRRNTGAKSWDIVRQNIPGKKTGTFRIVLATTAAGHNGVMPRTAPATPGGYCYHVLNRSNRRAEVYHTADDYAAFVALLRRTCARIPMRLLGYWLMPNPFHLALWPTADRDVRRWMQWRLTSQVHSYRKNHRTTGHVGQGRFKAFPIAEDTTC